MKSENEIYDKINELKEKRANCIDLADRNIKYQGRAYQYRIAAHQYDHKISILEWVLGL